MFASPIVRCELAVPRLQCAARLPCAYALSLLLYPMSMDVRTYSLLILASTNCGRRPSCAGRVLDLAGGVKPPRPQGGRVEAPKFPVVWGPGGRVRTARACARRRPAAIQYARAAISRCRPSADHAHPACA